MLRIANLLENLLVLIDVTEENEIIVENIFDSQKLKKLKNLAKSTNFANLLKSQN